MTPIEVRCAALLAALLTSAQAQQGLPPKGYTQVLLATGWFEGREGERRFVAERLVQEETPGSPRREVKGSGEWKVAPLESWGESLRSLPHGLIELLLQKFKVTVRAAVPIAKEGLLEPLELLSPFRREGSFDIVGERTLIRGSDDPRFKRARLEVTQRFRGGPQAYVIDASPVRGVLGRVASGSRGGRVSFVGWEGHARELRELEDVPFETWMSEWLGTPSALYVERIEATAGGHAQLQSGQKRRHGFTPRLIEPGQKAWVHGMRSGPGMLGETLLLSIDRRPWTSDSPESFRVAGVRLSDGETQEQRGLTQRFELLER